MIEGTPHGYQGSWNGIMKAMCDSLTELCPQTEICFNSPVLEVDIHSATIMTEQGSRSFDLILGCDGVGSVVRNCA